jgi:hypothetical protein
MVSIYERIIRPARSLCSNQYERLFHKNPHIDDRVLNCRETVRLN